MIGNKDDNDFDLQSVDDLTEIDLDDKGDNLSSLSASAGGRKFSPSFGSAGKKGISPVLLAVAGVVVVGAGLLFFVGGDGKPVAPPVVMPDVAMNVDGSLLQPDVPLPDPVLPQADITAKIPSDIAAPPLDDLPQPEAPAVLTPSAAVTADEVVPPIVETGETPDISTLPPIAAPTGPPIMPPASVDTAVIPLIPEVPVPAPSQEFLPPVAEASAPEQASVPVAPAPQASAPKEEPLPTADPTKPASPETTAADVEKVLEKALAGDAGVPALAANEFFDSASLPKLPDVAKPSSGAVGVMSPTTNPASGLVVVTKNASRDSVEALNAAAKRALSLGRHEAALDFYDQLYEKNPNDASVLVGRAVALQNLGRVEEAAVMYDKALAKDPNNPEILLNMLGLLKKQYPAVAFERLKMLRKDYPANALVAAQLGLAAAEAGDLEDGARNLQVAASLQPNNPQHYFNLGILYEKAGKTKDAVLAYEKALEVDAIYGSGRAVSRDVIYDRLSKLRG